jgi:hypothetical protein
MMRMEVYVITAHVDFAFAYVVGVTRTLSGATALAYSFATKNLYRLFDGGHEETKWVLMTEKVSSRNQYTGELDSADRIEINRLKVNDQSIENRGCPMHEYRFHLKGNPVPLVLHVARPLSREDVEAVLGENSKDSVYHIPAIGPYGYSMSIRTTDIQAIEWINSEG